MGTNSMEETKKLNQKSAQGNSLNTTNSIANDFSIQETIQKNQQSAKNASQQGNMMEAGSDMMTKQQNELEAVKKANQQSAQNKNK
ncbi:MAG: hypothetical protein QMB62_05625 [Oscillospiraceae bacterium]